MAKIKRTFGKMLVATGLTSLLALVLQAKADSAPVIDGDMRVAPTQSVKFCPSDTPRKVPGVVSRRPDQGIRGLVSAQPQEPIAMGKMAVVPAQSVTETQTASPLLPVIGNKTADAYMADAEAAGKVPNEVRDNPLLCPTNDLTIVVIKDTGRIEVRVGDQMAGTFSFDGPVGTPARRNKNPGPKFVSGDGRIPEGIYGLSIVNTTSLHGPALQLDYPNKDDVADAKADGRLSEDGTEGDLGGDVCFRGGVKPGSCIPLGTDIDRLAYMVLRTRGNGIGAKIVIAPYDMRDGRRPELEKSEFGWYKPRCDKIESELKQVLPSGAVGSIRDYPPAK